MRSLTRKLQRRKWELEVGKHTTLDAFIRALFAGGQQSAWYDPSDLTTLFQDSAGTQPVTALEQPVGLMLDKSRGLVLGPELVTNGDFSDGTTGWTFASGWTVSDGKAAKSTPGTANAVSQTVSITSGKFYKVLFDVSGLTAGSVNLRLGSDATVLFSATANGSYSPIVFAQSADSVLYFYSGSTFDGSIDNISVRELPGYHAYHTPGDTTTRPTLSRRINLLTKTEQFDDAAWARSNVDVTANSFGAFDLLSENTATGVHQISEIISLSPGAEYIYSISAKQGVGSRYLVINIAGGSPGAVFDIDAGVVLNTIAGTKTGVTASIASVGDGVYRCALRFTNSLDLTATNARVLLSNTGSSVAASYTGDGTSGIYIWGASLVPADLAALPYQRVNTTTDYDSDASRFPTFLRTDGVDDSLQTNAIDFTGTDKMFVGAAVRKLSDAAVGSVVGLSATPTTSAGTFEIYTPNANGSALHWFFSRGTSTASTSARYPAPITSVISGIGDISGDSAIMRVNGAQASASAVDQGTGNYGNYKLYLFRRGGSSLPFNGWMFGLLVKGSALSASQIALAERWLAEKTKTVTLA